MPGTVRPLSGSMESDRGAAPRRKNSENPHGGVMNDACRLTATRMSKPHQVDAQRLR
jgi:hypothetical protein